MDSVEIQNEICQYIIQVFRYVLRWLLIWSHHSMIRSLLRGTLPKTYTMLLLLFRQLMLLLARLYDVLVTLCFYTGPGEQRRLRLSLSLLQSARGGHPTIDYPPSSPLPTRVVGRVRPRLEGVATQTERRVRARTLDSTIFDAESIDS